MRISDWSSDVCSSDLGERIDIALEYTPGDRLVVAGIDETELAVKVAKTRTGWKMPTRGHIHDVRVLPWHIPPLTAHIIEKIPPALSNLLIRPMPALLVALHVGEGDQVDAFPSHLTTQRRRNEKTTTPKQYKH